MALVAVLTIATFAILLFAGKTFVSITLDPALAKAEGATVELHELVLMLLLASAIALSIKLAGIILITALLIIPAATAQNIARSLSSMFFASVLISILSVLSGMIVSIQLNTPPGPTIVVGGAVLFAVSLAVKPSLR